MKKHAEALYSQICDLNLVKIKDSCIQINDMISNHFTSDPKFDFQGPAVPVNKLFEQYNVLMYPLPEIHALYNTIKDFFYKCQIDANGKILKKNYFIQSWMNVYKKGEFIDWHNHGSTAVYAWHGFFCVNAENSKTTYQFKNSPELIDIESHNNLLVLGKSNTDFHRTYPWHDENNPRITVAFDIVPEDTILRLNGKKNSDTTLTEMIQEYPYFKNHWIPI
jgi:hypothetical protein